MINKKQLGNLIAVIIVSSIIIALILFSPSKEDEINYSYENAKTVRFNGIVSEKYIDTHDHGLPIIVVLNNAGVKYTAEFLSDRSGVYDYINVGDSVWKYINSIDVHVKRDGKVKVFTLDYNW